MTRDRRVERLNKNGRRGLTMALFAGAAILLGLTAGILFLELGLRVGNLVTPFIGKFDVDLDTGIHVYASHPFLNHTLTPNLDFERPAHSFPNIPAYRLKTNALGFRFDAARFASKPAGKLRIAVLGDSVVEGYEEKYSLPYLLERRLSRKHDVEVMNFGVMSYSPIIHYVNLKRTVLDFKPDLVILHFDMTDVFDDFHRYRLITSWDSDSNPTAVSPGMEYAGRNSDGKVQSVIQLGRDIALRTPFASIRNFAAYLIQRSFVARMTAFKMLGPQRIVGLYANAYYQAYPLETKVSAGLDISKMHEWCTDFDNPEVRAKVDFAFANVGRIDRLLREHGVPWILVTIPIREQLAGEHGKSMKPVEALASMAESKGIPFQTPVAEFRSALASGTEVYFTDTMHPNYQGFRIWARSLAPFVERQLDVLRKGG